MSVNFSNYYEDVYSLIQAAITAVDPELILQQQLRREGQTLSIGERTVPLDRGRIFVVSVGKSALPMARYVASLLVDELVAGVVVTKKGMVPDEVDLPRFAIFEAGHPVSDEVSLQAASAVHGLAEMATAEDIVLCLISGGASALLTEPIVPLAVWQQLIERLLASGCTIHELNVVRRCLDRIKGGGLVTLVSPAPCYALILSDVVGNDLHTIGSGLTVKATDGDALAVLTKYRVEEKLDTAVWQQIEAALAQETAVVGWQPPPAYNLIIGDVSLAAQAAFTQAVRRGFLTQILTTHLEGEAREVGRFVAAIAKDLPPKHCLILGGETTVTVRGEGQGGRNQEVALAAAIALAGVANTVVATVATDGDDHTTGMAGAVVTGETVINGRLHHLNAVAALQNNDSHTFFKRLDSILSSTVNVTTSDEAPATLPPPHLIHTGPTGTNVNDLIIILTYPTVA